MELNSSYNKCELYDKCRETKLNKKLLKDHPHINHCGWNPSVTREIMDCCGVYITMSDKIHNDKET